MKEESEYRPKEKRVTLVTPPGAIGSGGGASGDSTKGEDKQDRNKKKEALSKVVIRRLPHTLTKEHLQEHLQPMPEHDYFEFFSNDTSLYPHMYARAYINFKNQEDIILFRDRFDGYVFLDNKGQEYPAIVEFAPFQKAAKKKTKKRDTKVGTINDAPEYRKFLESYEADNEKMTSTPETLLEEIEAKNRELIAKKTTPLLSFLKNKQRMREEKREERRRREIERKRQREEERRKLKDEPKIKLLKKPEKGDEKELDKREKAKKLDKENLNDERASGQSCTLPKRSDGKLKDEKLKRPEDESGRDYREKRDYERDQERKLRERERLKRQEEEHRRQKECCEKEKAFKRKEEEMKKEKDALRDKGKKTESTESVGSAEKIEKKEEVVKRDRVRNKDRPAMQLYQPGARSRNRLCPPDDNTKSGDSAIEKK
ncbi:Regulator Of Nonsense Transcripts 3B [Manis pentadactyla]|nr:Regulator Of Nonsense Transcripts 3B [Manis pentadactyla]